jgi:RNA polymerase primary sigma factor
LQDALEKLSDRERGVLELRYGLGGEHPRTLDEIGRRAIVKCCGFGNEE